jgi:hypothetical protein
MMTWFVLKHEIIATRVNNNILKSYMWRLQTKVKRRRVKEVGGENADSAQLSQHRVRWCAVVIVVMESDISHKARNFSSSVTTDLLSMLLTHLTY